MTTTIEHHVSKLEPSTSEGTQDSQSPAAKCVTFAEPADDDTLIPLICTQLVRILRCKAQVRCPMPIPVNNSLPTFHITLRNSTKGSIQLGCLFDSCAAVSSGYKLFHWYLMSQYPKVMHSYEESTDPSQPFQPIKLAGAVRDPENQNKDVLGKLVAMVCYHTPYKCTNGNPCSISFALSNDVTVNTILGWPAISALGMNMLTSKGCIFSNATQTSFPITNHEPHFGLPDGVTFNPSEFSTPPTPSASFTRKSDTQTLHQFAASVAPPAMILASTPSLQSILKSS